MSAPFQPKGDKAVWEVCYDLVVALEPGGGITYTEVQNLCGCNRSGAIQGMLTAKEHLERDGHYTVANRRNFGWDVINAKGTLSEVAKRRKKTTRALGRTARGIGQAQILRAELSATDRAELDEHAAAVLGATDIATRKPVDVMALYRAGQKKLPQ